MQQLVCRHIIQYQTDSIGRVQARWYRYQFVFLQADKLRVRTRDRQCSNDLPSFNSRDPRAELIDHTYQLPTWCEGQRWCLRMNALAHHDVGQGHACGQHLYAHFACRGLAVGMAVSRRLTEEKAGRSWSQQVLAFGLAELLLVTPSGWSLTESSQEVRLPA